MMAKSHSLLSELQAAKRRPKTLGFFSKLPADKQEEFLSIAGAIASGEIVIGIAAVARRLKDEWKLPLSICHISAILREKVAATND